MKQGLHQKLLTVKQGLHQGLPMVKQGLQPELLPSKHGVPQPNQPHQPTHTQQIFQYLHIHIFQTKPHSDKERTCARTIRRGGGSRKASGNNPSAYGPDLRSQRNGCGKKDLEAEDCCGSLQESLTSIQGILLEWDSVLYEVLHGAPYCCRHVSTLSPPAHPP